MKLINFFYILILCFVLSACNNSVVSNKKCNEFKKTSKQYVNCMNDLVLSTNTLKNFKEFKKHRNLKSFFEQVQIIESN